MLASARVLNNGELTGSTPDNATAPIRYTLTVSSSIPGLGTKVTTINSSTFFDVVSSETVEGFVILTLSPGREKIYLTSGEAASFVTALKQAKTKVDAELKKAATVATPTFNIAPTNPPKTISKPANTNITTTTNTTANTKVTTTVTSNAVTKTTVTNTTNTTAKQTTAGKPVSKPATVPTVIAETKDIVINPVPVTIPEIDIKTGKPTGKGITIQTAPVTIPGEKLLSDGTVVPNTGKTAPSSEPPATGLTAGIKTAAGAATAQDQANLNKSFGDWRVRLSLAPGTNYLYNDPDGDTILQPLQKTDGVIFPYTPNIVVNYAARYDNAQLTHTNYTVYQYQGSSVDQVTITCEFTAQDVFEANYLLAVIHFFKSMTKMFYGQDSDPKNGTPPPLCYIYGMGGYQFDALPLAISGFSYNLPAEVDYIKTTGASAAGTTQPSIRNRATNAGRLGTGISQGGRTPRPDYGATPSSAGESSTWVPTKIQLSITCLPVMSRNQVSNNFSFKDYASGKLLQGSRRPGGGMW